MKRKALKLQQEILAMIKDNPGITMSKLERKIGTNPQSLKEHCEQLEWLKKIKINKNNHTTTLHTT